jgi:membrane associated rhomboid family serine protease
VPVLSRAEPWRFLTAGLVHSPGLVLHLALNGFALWSIGREVEAVLGRWRYGSLLALSTLASSVGVLWLTTVTAGAWNGITVGASGAVFGLLGTGVLLEHRRGGQVGRQVGVLVLLAVAGFLLPGISWQGHVGGLAGGLMVGAALVLAPRARRTRWQLLGLLLVLLVLVGATALRWALVGPGSLV